MTFEDKAVIVISQLRADRDRLQNAIDKIRAEISEYKDEKIIHAERNEMIDIVLDIIDKHIQNTCDRCGKSIDHYGLCEECDKWLEDNYGEGKKNV